MRWVLAASCVMWSVVASAQTMTIPVGFAKTAGGDAYKALAQPGDQIEVHAYRAGEAELVTVAWQWKSDVPTRAGLARFDHDLVGRSRPDAAKEVSNTAMFDRDPMQVEVFDMLGGQRVYHRRLYAVDAKNVVHVWWTVCTAPATAIEPCEQAQRTMTLDLAHALALPALPPPPASTPAASAPAPAPAPGDAADKPWQIDVPAGYHELFTDAVEDMLEKARIFPRVDHVEAQLYRSPNDDVRLLASAMRMTREGDAPNALVEQMNFGITRGAAATEVAGANVASTMTTEKLERRTLYAADGSYVYAYTVACVGRAERRADCVRALATMRLAVPDQIAPSSPEWTRDHHRSPVGQLLIVLGLVVVPLGLIFWIAKNWERWRRRRRAPSARERSRDL
ncbi:MAG TPA: hypothetical protein VIV58_07790, partial [Kofleriaceae bacterium]